MKYKTFFLIFLVGLTLSACVEYETDSESQKRFDDCTTLNGQVTTIDGNASFNNVPIGVVWHKFTRKGELGGFIFETVFIEGKRIYRIWMSMLPLSAIRS